MTPAIRAAEHPGSATALGILVSRDLKAPSGRPVDAAYCARRGFSGKVGENLVLGMSDGVVQVLVGCGDIEDLDLETLRRVGAGLVSTIASEPVIAIDASGLGSDGANGALYAQALGEGAGLCTYRFSVRDEDEKVPREPEAFVIVGAGREAPQGARSAQSVVEAVRTARNLANTPAGDLTPRAFAAFAEELAERKGFSISVYDEDRIAADRLGGLAGVAAGSDEPARLVRLFYEPVGAPSAPSVALVGKGITFDSGGLSLKPWRSMTAMKTDMSGAAAALATIGACRELRIGVRVVAFLPLAENLPGPRATKPGDVLRARDGTAMEVLNTDAEGRLVLADALCLAVEEGPDAIVDLATLTGACVAALGGSIAGLMGNDDRLMDKVSAAARRAGEPVWPLPLALGYKKDIESSIADIKNIGVEGKAGALAGGLFLEHFVRSTPWAHLDIAGPARSDEEHDYIRKGSTGFGVRTLLELLRSYEPIGGPAQLAAGQVVYR